MVALLKRLSTSHIKGLNRSKTIITNATKEGTITTHPLRANEFRTLRAWLTERAQMKPKTKALSDSPDKQVLTSRPGPYPIRDLKDRQTF
jgi:hypothetical protein